MSKWAWSSETLKSSIELNKFNIFIKKCNCPLCGLPLNLCPFTEHFQLLGIPTSKSHDRKSSTTTEIPSQQ